MTKAEIDATMLPEEAARVERLRSVGKAAAARARMKLRELANLMQATSVPSESWRKAIAQQLAVQQSGEGAELARANTLHRVASTLDKMLEEMRRLADAVAPRPADVVGTDFVADRLGCTSVWVAEMAREGEIPRSCIVPGTGNGKVWKFKRREIDAWLNKR